MNADPLTTETPVDVIVRTMGEGVRRRELLHALDTIRAQEGIQTTAIVVVNGERFDPALVEEIKNRDGVRFAYLREASLIAAGLRGRELVDAPYFTFLDDDDELLSDTLAEAANWLRDHPTCDVVVSNIYRRIDGQTMLASDDMAEHEANPLFTLMAQCWLHPGAGLFRTIAVDSDLLDFPRAFMEWTTLAFRLVAAGKRLHFMQTATVIYNDTAGSISKSYKHQENALLALAEIMEHPVSDACTRQRARDKYANTLHVLAMHYWQARQYRKAWDRHLRSLRHGGLFKYALFTRKLVVPVRAR